MGDASSVDVLIQGAGVFDGGGDPSKSADIAIRGDRIVAVGRGLDLRATRAIDARGLAACPGCAT